MNKINATIESIEFHEGISAVTFDAMAHKLMMVSLDLNKSLKKGTHVTLGIKATHIALSKKLHDDISLSNQLIGSIRNIENGKILCSVILYVKGTYLESIITQKSAQRMNIKIGDEIVALMKASDLYIASIKE